MPYKLLYDVTQDSSFDFFSVGIALVLLLSGAVLTFCLRNVVRPLLLLVLGAAFMGGPLLFLLGWTLLSDPHNGPLKAALREGRCTVVEGPVTNFRPKINGEEAPESFEVGGTKFEYSEFRVEPGFKQTRTAGGPMREGLQVRIHHLNNRIARLEAAGELPADATAQQRPLSITSFFHEPVVWFLGGGLAFSGFLQLLRSIRENGRAEKLRAVARDLQLDYETGQEAALLDSLRVFPVIFGWRLKQVRNVMRGTVQGAEVTVFEFSAKQKQTGIWRTWAVAQFTSSKLQLPSFSLQPRLLLNFDAIELLEFPAFSESVSLTGPSKDPIRQLFDRELIAALETKHGITVEGAGDRLLFYRRGASCLEPNEFRSFLAEAVSVFEQFAAARARTEHPTAVNRSLS